MFKVTLKENRRTFETLFMNVFLGVAGHKYIGSRKQGHEAAVVLQLSSFGCARVPMLDLDMPEHANIANRILQP